MERNELGSREKEKRTGGREGGREARRARRAWAWTEPEESDGRGAGGEGHMYLKGRRDGGGGTIGPSSTFV